jgi:hypothetical protein
MPNMLQLENSTFHFTDEVEGVLANVKDKKAGGPDVLYDSYRPRGPNYSTGVLNFTC